jgi:hypothetical protein
MRFAAIAIGLPISGSHLKRRERAAERREAATPKPSRRSPLWWLDEAPNGELAHQILLRLMIR